MNKAFTLKDRATKDNITKLTYNEGDPGSRVLFIQSMLRMTNLLQSTIDLYKESGALYNKKTKRYEYKVNYNDPVDLLIGTYAQNLYWESLKPGGTIYEKYFTRNELLDWTLKTGVLTNIGLLDNRIKNTVKGSMLDRSKFNDLCDKTKDYIIENIHEPDGRKYPKYVFCVSEKAINIATLPLNQPDTYDFSLSHIADKQKYLDLMLNAINTLCESDRHKIIDSINP
tara:strand:- start:744 stop:1424 length:681 start_codon:yes stop_codon:yes gene_type:complete